MALDDPDEVRGFSPTDAIRVARAVRWVEKQQSLQEKNRGHTGNAEPAGTLFYNDSGEVIPPFSIMKHDGGVLDTSEGIVFLKVKKPDTTFAQNYLLNDLEEIPIGGFGRAQDGRNVTVAYDTGTPVRRDGGGPKPGQWTWSKGYPCLVVAQEISDTTAKYLQGEFISITTLLGKTTAAVTANSSPDSTKWDIYTGTAGSEADSTFDAPTAYCRVAIAIGKFVQVFWVNNHWEMTPLEC